MDEPGLASKDPKTFIVRRRKRLLTFIRVEIDVPPTNGATQICHHFSQLDLVL